MAEINTVIAEASQDLQTIEDFVNLPADSEVFPRLLPSVNVGTLAGTRQAIFEAGGLPATPFETKALMEASSLVDGSYAVITHDTQDNVGLYLKRGTGWVKSGYDTSNLLRDKLKKDFYTKVSEYDKSILTKKGVNHNGISVTGLNAGSIPVFPEQMIEITTAGSFSSAASSFTLNGQVVAGKVTRLDSPIDGINTLNYIVPSNATGFTFSCHDDGIDEFNIVVYDKKTNLDGRLAGGDVLVKYKGFRNNADIGTSLKGAVNSNYSSLVIPVQDGKGVLFEGLTASGVPTLAFIDEKGFVTTEFSTDSGFSKIPSNAKAVLIQNINESHNDFSSFDQDSFNVQILNEQAFFNKLEVLGYKDEFKSSVFTDFTKNSNLSHSQDYGMLEITLPYGEKHYYLKASMRGTVSPYMQTVDADNKVVRTFNGNDALNYITEVGEFFNNEVLVRCYTMRPVHSDYKEAFSALLITSETREGLYKSITKEVGLPDFGFEYVGHPSTGSATYKRTRPLYLAKGSVINYNLNTRGTKGVWNGDGASGEVPDNGSSFTMPVDGWVKLTTFNSTHSDYSPVFEPYYTLSESGHKLIKRSGLYLPTFTLKSIREVLFSDGSDRLAIEYLWHDEMGNFYLSDAVQGEKKYIFTYNKELMHGEDIHHFSMNFDASGNIVCVFRIEQLSYSAYTDDSRKNPVILLRDREYKPVVVDFGSSKKPSGWLQNCGFICTDDYIMLTEYTRPSVKTANTWKATYPLTDVNNWKTVQTFDLSPEVNPSDNMKHIHSVNRDPHTGFIYTTTGDNNAGAAMFVSTDEGETFTKILDGSEKYCRTLNFVFDKDYIYWATDSSGDNHWFFKAPRDTEGLLDVSNITDLAQFPYDSPPTYASIYMRNLNIMLFLNRNDGNKTEIPIDAWDFETEQMIRMDTLSSTDGVALPSGFRCECFEYYPRGNSAVCGFSQPLGSGGYPNYIGVLGNTRLPHMRVNNLILNISRAGSDFKITYSTNK